MAPYFDHMHTKSTHERRMHAMRVAGVVTALVFAGWITSISLGATTNGTGSTVAGSDNSSQTASAINSQGGLGNQLVVATSTY